MAEQHTDAVIVGAGFAGLYAIYRLREMGLSVRCLERGGGLGGTWFWNRYPGARCDIESLEYSYQFSAALQDEWRWSERYATQPEILRYLEHVAERFKLRPHITFNARVQSAHFDARNNRWQVQVQRGGETETISARHCIMATGCLSEPNTPEFPGAESFAGAVYHTGRWPHEGADFRGLRVGIIGTGSSAIQSLPIIAEQAAHVTVFQRTPNYSVPAWNGPVDPRREAEVRADYPGFRARNKLTTVGADFRRNEQSANDATPEERARVFEQRWREGGLPFSAAFNDLLLDADANESAAEFVRGKIRSMVRDPATAEALCPQSVLGCKRLCVDSGYYEAYNRPNVTLAPVAENPIRQITPRGLTLESGAEYQFDALIYATGFDAMTGALKRIDIRGEGGLPLRDAWAEGPKAYLGLASRGFPNLFLVTGPGSPSVLSNMVPSIEQHVDFIADAIGHMRARGFARMEARADAQENWVRHVNEVAGMSLYPNCNSWYLGANIPGKPRVFMPYIGFAEYVQKCKEVAAADYEGFAFQAA